MQPTDTARLRFRRITTGDSAFILALYNAPAFQKFIGDRGLKTEQDSHDYIRDVLIPIYDTPGLGLFCLELTETADPVGICGLLQRDYLEAPDLGFGFLPQHEGRGYGREAALATLQFARADLQLQQVLATATSHNQRSRALLNKLGFEFVRVHEHMEKGVTLDLFRLDLTE